MSFEELADALVQAVPGPIEACLLVWASLALVGLVAGTLWRALDALPLGHSRLGSMIVVALVLLQAAAWGLWGLMVVVPWQVLVAVTMVVRLSLWTALGLGMVVLKLPGLAIGGRRPTHEMPSLSPKHRGLALAITVVLRVLPDRYRVEFAADITEHCKDEEQQSPSQPAAHLRWALGIVFDLVKGMVAAWLAELVPDWVQALFRLVTGR